MGHNTLLLGERWYGDMQLTKMRQADSLNSATKRNRLKRPLHELKPIVQVSIVEFRPRLPSHEMLTYRHVLRKDRALANSGVSTKNDSSGWMKNGRGVNDPCRANLLIRF